MGSLVCLRADRPSVPSFLAGDSLYPVYYSTFTGIPLPFWNAFTRPCQRLSTTREQERPTENDRDCPIDPVKNEKEVYLLVL